MELFTGTGSSSSWRGLLCHAPTHGEKRPEGLRRWSRLVLGSLMVTPRKPHPSLADYARHMLQEAVMAEDRADILGQAAKRIEQDGDVPRAEAMRHTCRKIRVQALLDRCRAAAAEMKAQGG